MSWRCRAGQWLQQGSLAALLIFLPFSKAAVEIAFGVMLVGWVMEYASPTRVRSSLWSRPEARGLLTALLSYVVASGLSILHSSYPDISVRGFITKTLEYAVYFMMAAELGLRRRMRERSVALLLMATMFVGLDAVVQAVTHYDVRGHTIGLRESAYFRITGPYENPIDLATYFMVTTPFIIAQVGMGGRARTAALVSLLGLASWCVMQTDAQGAQLGLMVALALMCLMTADLRRLIPWYVAGLALAIMTHWSYLSNWFVGAQDRLLMWRAGWAMFIDRPLFGHGINTFMANYLTYRVGGEATPRYAHNCYLQVAAETGLLGLAAFAWLLGAIIWVITRAVRFAPERAHQRYLLGALGGLAAFLVQSAFDTNFYALRHAALFWVLAGLAVGAAWSAQETA